MLRQNYSLRQIAKEHILSGTSLLNGAGNVSIPEEVPEMQTYGLIVPFWPANCASDITKI
jgi:hypothetical protein